MELNLKVSYGSSIHLNVTLKYYFHVTYAKQK